MSTKFATTEASNSLGHPTNLYKFVRGTVLKTAITYLYAEADRDVTLGDDTYIAVDVSDQGVSMSGNATTDTFELTIPSNTDIVKLYAGTAPSDSIYLTVRRYHPGDADAVVTYVGTISSVSQTSPGLAKISCVALSASFRRDGLRIAWERGCPYALYDQNCKVDRTHFLVYGIVTAIYGNTLTVPTTTRYADAWFAGGYIEWQLDRYNTERRGIQGSDMLAGTIQMFGEADGIEVGMNIILYPGCARTSDVCLNKFSNFDNYGGFPMLPGKSPFDGDPIF